MILLPHQKEALAYTFKTDHPALFLDMRLGKSVVYSYRVRSYPKNTMNLIVCPISAIDGWIKALREITQVEPIVLYGERLERLEGLRAGARFYIINWDGIRVIPEIATVKWYSLCLDESHLIKNPKSKTTKYFSKHFKKIPHRWILTGTPDTEATMDIIPQFNFLDPFILRTTYWEFRTNYTYMSDYMKFKPNSRGERLLALAMSKAFIRTRKDVDFPCEKIYENRYLTLPPEMQKKYDICEKEFLIEEMLKQNPLDFKTLFSIQKAVWLRLMTSGIINGKIVWQDKIAETLLIVSGTSESVIIWATFIDEFNLIIESLKKNKITHLGINGAIPVKKRTDLIKQFNSGEKRVLVAQPECYRFGADLSKSSVMIYFSQPNSLITKVQTEDRVVHLTKKCPVMIYNMIVKNTIDEDMTDSFSDKKTDSLRLRKLVNEIS